MNEQSRKRKQRNLNIQRGIPNRVSAAEAAQHIASLRTTMSWADLATAAAMSACHLRRIANGLEPRINRGTHNKILAISAKPGGWIFVNALGSRRRIHALQANGHSQDAIAENASTTQHRIYVVSNGHVTTVRMHFAERIAQAYQALAPLTGSSARGRNLAARNGWLGPAWWDDDELDNPDYEPAIQSTPRYIALSEDCLELESQGHSREQIAARLGVTRDGLQRALSIYRQKTAAAA